MMEAPAQHNSVQAITTSTHIELRLGSSKVAICMSNLSARSVTIPARTIIGSVFMLSIIPPMLAPKIKILEEK